MIDPENLDETNEEYDPLEEDFEFDTEFLDRVIFAKHMDQAIDGFKFFIRSFIDFAKESQIEYDETGDFDWYERFLENKDNPNNKQLIIDVSDTDLLDLASVVSSLPPDSKEYKDAVIWCMEQDTLDEFYKILDAFGYFDTKLKTINNFQDFVDASDNQFLTDHFELEEE